MQEKDIFEGFDIVKEVEPIADSIDTKKQLDDTSEVDILEGFEIIKEEKQPEVDVEALKEKKAKRFDKGIFKMAEREAFDKYKETGEIDINLLPQEELEEEASKYSKDVSLGVKMLNEIIESKINFQNVLDNLPIQLRNTFDDVQGYSVKFLENLEKGAGDFLVTDSEIFEKPITFKDPETNELIDFKTNPQRFKELNKLNSTGNTRNTIESFYGDTGIKVGEPTKKYIISQFKQVEERSKKLKQTGSITEGGKKLIQGDIDGISDLFGGSVNAVGSVVQTVVPAAITFGTSLPAQVIAPMFREYNIQKAKTIFPESNDPLKELEEKGEIEIATPTVLGVLATGLEYVGFKGIAGKILNKAVSFKPLTSLLLTGNKEGVTELGQHGVEVVNKSLAKGETVENSILKGLTSMASQEGLESYLQGFIGGTSVAGPGSLVNRALRSDKESSILINKSISNLNSLNSKLKETKDEDLKSIIKQKISEVEKSLKDYLINNKVISENISNEQKNELIELINKKDKYFNSYNNLLNKYNDNEITKEEFDFGKKSLEEEYDLVSKSISDIRNSVNIAQIEEQIKIIEPKAKELGVVVNSYETSEEFIKATGQDASVDGFINDKGEIFINKQRAAETGAVNVAAHELLHNVLKNEVSDFNKAKKLVDDFKKVLSEEELEVVQKRIDDNYKFTIDEQGNRVERPESEYIDEYLTAFSDAIGQKDIIFNENIFTKIGDVISSILRAIGFKKIKFNTGRDVYNFIKDYQKNIAKGKVSKQTLEVSKTLKDVEGEIKMSKTASENVQKIYEEQGVGGALDIIEEFKPIVNKIVQRRSEAPNFDRQLLTDEIETGKRGLLELIQDYDIESGVPLAAYINKFLPARAIEASRRVLGETFEEDISQRVDIAAPEVEVEIKTKEEKVPRSLRKKLNIETGSDLYNKVKDAVVKTFGTKLPEVTDPKFKKALSDSYKRELKKEINSLMGTRSDFKMFVTNNAETLYKSIPQETINKRFQAFSEPVLDKEGKQVREKTAVGKGVFKKKPFNKEEFINYFLGEDVGASTKGTRKTALSETIADEMALDATMEVIEDPKVFEKFKEIQEIEGKEVPKDIKPKISEKVKRPQGFKFSASSINNASRKFLRKKGVKEIKFNFENEEFTYDVNKGPLKNTDNTAVKYYQYITQEILPKYLPISNLVNSNNYASRSDKFGRGHFMTGKQRTSIVNKGLKNERKFTDRERKIVKETTSQKAFTTTKKGKKQLVNFGSKEYLQKTTNNYDGLEYILFQLQEMVKDYPGTSTYVAALFNSASGNSGHFIRQSAMPRGVDQGFIDAGFKGEKEHIWQQNQAAETMFDDILNGTVKKNFSFIKDNYFMLGISNTNNNKLKDLSGKYGEKYNYGNLPPNIFIDSLVEALKNNDFSKAMSIWIRYFNSNVNRNNGGMNPNSLTFDGKTVAELFNVGVEAKYRNNPDVIAFQNSLIEDQIVNGLDPKAAKELLNEYLKLIPTKKKANKFSKSILSNSKVLDVEGNLSTQDLLNKAAAIDEALKIARDPNTPVKKIRVFDFDDTLARSKSLVFYNRPNDSGKPVPNNKAIFMIGGPGSGKSNIGKGLQLGRDGWKVVNQDIFIESEKAKQGLPEIEKDYTKEQRSKRAKIGAAGRKAAEAKMDKYTKAGNGMVIDGTGASYNATMKKVNKLREQGYEVFMVHAKTSNEVALERNKARKERSLPDFIVEKTQESVNNNISQYKSDLGDNFIEIDTETIEYGKPLPKEFVNDAKAKFYATERGKLNAEEFAEQGAGLIEEGFAMDFSDFNIVREGEKGPLFDVAKKIQKARGTDDVFVLTARASESQQAIYEFLKSEGLEIPLENITGLGNSTGEAKANWLVDKAAEGYNDFYFADDAYQNVKAVKDAMSVLDVKSKVQQAKVKFSKSVNKDFNKIIEQTTGIASEKVYSEAKAKVRGANKGNKKFFIPYSAEDFMGLIYPLLSKGKLGDSQMAWFKQNLLDPYARAQENMSTDRLQLMEDFKALKKALEVPKDLRKKTDSGFTKEQAVRVYLFNKAGFDVPGISKTDLNELLDLVNSDGVLKAFGDQIFNITKGDGYAKPGENWLVGTITTDLIDVLNTVKRAKYLEQSGYTANAELIFSKENLNKLEAAYGAKYREAMENILGRMKSGKNRIFSGNRLSNRVLDYINNSTGAIMFFNTRSAVLQTISSINFLNWSFNNPIKAGAAFANQPQYWKDFVELINSDYLIDRRNGLKLNINESEIADAAATSKNKAKAAINYILQKGFLPTQFADSFAIASGGATFYRNRINDLIKNQDMPEADAKKQAMLEWRETAEISQQSSDPSKISAQQSSDLGRVILAFANTPMQYARIQKRAVQDLVKGRGDAKTNVSKIIYYAVVQNLIFNALQSALFGLGFGDDEDDEKKEKMYLRTANGMLDSQLRGLGLAGATVAVIKNFLTDIYERSGRQRPEYVDSIYKLLQISPPISSKISKIRGAAYQFDSKKRREEIFDKGFSIDNPAYEAGAKVISATANIPLDRVYSKVNNISGSMDEDAETWQTIAMLAGWPKWQIMPKDKTSSELPKFEGRKVKKFNKSNYKNWKKKRYSKR